MWDAIAPELDVKMLDCPGNSILLVACRNNDRQQGEVIFQLIYASFLCGTDFEPVFMRNGMVSDFFEDAHRCHPGFPCKQVTGIS